MSTSAGRLTRILTDHRGGSASSRLRRERWQLLADRFSDLSEMRVLDIGGLADAWLDAPVRPQELVVLNLPTWSERAARSGDRLGGHTTVRHIAGDACDPPEELRGERFDLVHCNSVIEHVGGHQRRVELANAIHRLGRHHWVQTPYRYFPIEAHTLFPGLQFLPVSIRAAAMRRWPLGHMRMYSSNWPRTEAWDQASANRGRPLRRLNADYAVLGVQSIELLSKAEMRAYFVTSQLIVERVSGLIKSLIAVR